MSGGEDEWDGVERRNRLRLSREHQVVLEGVEAIVVRRLQPVHETVARVDQKVDTIQDSLNRNWDKTDRIAEGLATFSSVKHVEVEAERASLSLRLSPKQTSTLLRALAFLAAASVLAAGTIALLSGLHPGELLEGIST